MAWLINPNPSCSKNKNKNKISQVYFLRSWYRGGKHGLKHPWLLTIPAYCIYLWLPSSFFLLNLSSSLWLLLQYLSKLVVYLYHWSILLGGFSVSINFLLITLFIPLLNSFVNNYSLYLFPLVTLLNSCTNSSTFFNLTIFIVLLFPSPNLFEVWQKFPYCCIT